MNANNTIKNTDQSLPWHGIVNLYINLHQGGDKANLFSNKRHQVIVDVYISAVDINGDYVSVPNEVMAANTWLIDYNTGEKLAMDVGEDSGFTWAYSDSPNEFTAVVMSGYDSFMENYSQPNDGSRLTNKLTYYVYCSPSVKNTIKNIAVLVHAPDGDHSTKIGSPIESHVELFALKEIVYEIANITLDREFITGHHTGDTWEQYNTYVSIDPKDAYGRRYIVKLADDHNMAGNAHQLYRGTNDDKRGYIAHFFWVLGDEATVSIGNREWMGVNVDFPVDIKIRQQSNTVCFTVIQVMYKDAPSYNTWYDFYIIIYDQYGNEGKIWVVENSNSENDEQLVHFSDSPPES
ncbi:MAG: hypothetical protein LBI71_06595 [Enterobacteriaceae bacterium]|jgi:hypothetical protein|nr:hypothetical protein [Enterobacteriaceae bacterium]